MCNKTRRITFIQVENTIESLIDTSKVADIVVLMINAKDGLDMSTMEYIHCLQSHGMPKVIAVITHLDHYKDNKQQRTVKKTIKDRLWKELYGGLKVFFMSGMKYENYLKRDLLNLTRFINTQKVRPLEFRQSHSYVLVDRMEDLTPTDQIKANPDSDRRIALYGYSRGLPFNHTLVHVVGAGDFQIKDISHLPDPCPLQPEKKRLAMSHKLIYAPQSDLNGIQYDKDAIYVTMPISKENELIQDMHQQSTLIEDGALAITADNTVNALEESDSEEELEEGLEMEELESEVENENSDDEHDSILGNELIYEQKVSDDEDDYSLDEMSEIDDLFVTQMHKDVENALEYSEDNEEDPSSEDNEDIQEAIDQTVMINKFEAKEDNNLFVSQKEEMQANFDKDMAHLESLKLEDAIASKGYLPGTYIRIEIDISPEFVNHWDPNRICIVGGLFEHEINKQFIHCRVKKHKWYPQILKTNDPIICSMGWRRFQTMPVYCKSDTIRHQYLKYTPEYDYCHLVMYGPQIAPNTGFIAIQKCLNVQQKHFRICLNGVALSNHTDVSIKKKLKLTGTPKKIHKNTAFIENMFTSQMEVAKFENALIRTVSGIRGQIKKPCTKPPGVFRATFEDKLVMSDIVFLRSWVDVPIEPFCVIVNNLFLSPLMGWQGMRSMRELRDAINIKPALHSDSYYKPIERVEKKFHPLRIPRKLEMKLPFASRPKIQEKLSKDSYQKKRAVVLEKHEKEKLTLLQQLRTIKNEKETKRDLKKKELQKKRQVEFDAIEERKQASIRDKQQKRGIKESLKRRKEDKMGRKKQKTQ